MYRVSFRQERDPKCTEETCLCTSSAHEESSLSPAGQAYYLRGLTCAACAAKIEDGLNRMEGVSARLDFATSTLFIEADGERIKHALALVREIEPHLDIMEKGGVDGEEEEDGSAGARILRKIFGAGIFFVVGLVLQNYFLEGADRLPAGDVKLWMVIMPFAIAYVIAGRDIVAGAVRGVLKRNFFGEETLMTIATLGAFAIREFPEAVGVMLFFKVGEYFEERALAHSRRSIRALLRIRPDYANLRKNGETVRVRPEDVKVGDFIVVRPGEKVPLDGIITDGLTSVDTSALTGESLPRSLAPGDEILSGMINSTAVITVKVTRPFGESTVSRILDLVEKASANRAPTEKFITKFSRIYTPAVVTAALLMAVVPPLLYRMPAFTSLFAHAETYSEWIYRALVFLVIACPCALVISIPVGFFGGIGAASRKGILFKGSNYLEAFRNVHTIVFDKTGTLTVGSFSVTGIYPAGDFTEEELLRSAAEAESHSNHPIARSILDAYGKEIDESRIEGYREISSHGVMAVVDGREILAGSDRILHMDGIDIDHDTCGVKGTVVHVVVERAYAGYILLSDSVRPEARGTIDALRTDGVDRVVMLTGDNTEVAESVAQELGLDEFHAELLPQDKVDMVGEMVKRSGAGGGICFVGDGINDAPVLAASDIGIAMGGLGSDAAIEAADIVLMNDRLTGLLDARHISRRTRKIVYQNITMALLIKGFFILFGAAGLATMWEAVFADVGVAILAVLNSTRVLSAGAGR